MTQGGDGREPVADEGVVRTPDGARLYYRAVGRAGPLVIVPNGIYLMGEMSALTRGRQVVFFDPRSRGRSEGPGSGIEQDAADVQAVAGHFSSDRVDLVGHSFAGLLVALVARAAPGLVRRVVQIAPIAFDPDRAFADGLMHRDEVFAQVMRDLRALLPRRAEFEPQAFCEAAWNVLRPLYVTSPADAWRINWGRCDLPNERNGMAYFNQVTLPSIRRLGLTAEAFAGVRAPVLVVHGTKDRSAPYGGGRQWASVLPDARLVSVPGAGHAPWVEGPEVVSEAVDAFLGGAWPAAAERVREAWA